MSEFLDRITKLSPKRLALLAVELQSKLEALEGAGSEPLAVIGLGCRFPGGADSPAAFWRLLERGGDAITEVPRDRWDVDAYFDPDPDAPGKMSTRFGGFIADVDRFDAQFFGITPREAASMDPQQRLLLEVAWEALEDAGQAPDRLTGSATGVFVGLCNADYFQGIVRGDAAGLDAYVATGGAHSVAAGRLAYLLGLQGPNLAVDTACSSSLVAIHLACQSLRSGECRMALAGGVNVILSPETTIILSRAHMMAPDGRCKAFDARADGFVRAEGAGLVVLKRLSDAQADGDEVLAIIRGTAINQDGRSNGLTAPNGPAQEAVLRSALANARVAPHEVVYVEAHGTGTSLGDPIEVRALGAVLGAGRSADRPVLVGSLKTNIGHLESAAGVAGLIKVVQALRHGQIPAQLHFETPNPHIPWDQLAVEVASRPRPWPAGRRIAGVSSFGFSGTNAHLVVEAAPAPATAVEMPAARPAHVLTLSAKSAPALRALAGRWATCFEQGPAPLADLCATARGGRATLEHRLAVTVATPEQARECLATFARTGTAPGVVTGRAAKARAPEVAFLFTGQGAQYPGMGRALYEGHPAFRTAIDRCDAALRGVWEHRLTEVMHGGPGGPSLDDTAYTQVALFAIEWALAQVWKAWGVTPAIVMGHSVGEYAAACVAGALDVEEAIRMVAARGRLMGALPRGGVMVAVPADEARVREVLDAAGGPGAEIAAINGPESVVVAGAEPAVAAVVAALARRGITSQPLRVSHAFHTRLMEPMQASFETEIAGIRGRALQVPMVSSVTGQVVEAGADLGAGYWVRQVREPVRFGAALQMVRRIGGEGLWVEIGPHPVLTGLGRPWLAGGEWVPTLRRGQEDWKMLLGAVGTLWTRGVGIDWRGDGAADGRRSVAGLPTYPFERERHWLEAARPRPVPALSSPGAHPLLGTRVRSAAPIPHFETRLGAASPGFLSDHRVHGVVIAPSPALIEMATAAAAQVLGDECPVLTEFAIEQPLVLPAAAPVAVQTVVTPGEGGAAAIEIASLEDEATSRWRVHARAIARRGPPAAAPTATGDLAGLKERCPDAIAGADYYAMLAGRGLDFGPCFRGIARLWRGEREALGEIVVPDGLRAEIDRYRVHPAILDACLQTLGGAWPAGDEETYLLVGADRVSLPAPGSGAAPRFSHAILRDGDPRSGVVMGDVRVLDTEGRVIAELEGVHLRRARPESLARASAPGDWLYQVEWRPAATRPSEAAQGLGGPRAISAALEPQVGAIAAGEGLALYDALLPALDVLSYQYVLRAFADLGWAPVEGERVDAATLAATLGIQGKHRRLLACLLGILAEEGALRRVDGGWVVLTPLAPADVAGAEQRIAGQFPTGAAEITVTRDCGRALASALRGETDPLQLLFGPAALANTERLYTGSPAARTFNTLVARAVMTAIGASPRARRVRILEIGAGTGGTTNAILEVLPEGAVEYVFTDVSPGFTARAAERLAAPHRSFRPLDIEHDPAEQGMGAERFDIVVAANVLHATRDLRRTVAHARSLLAPGGLLILLEGTARYRWVDLTFGLTDGWWRFSDADLRAEHALLGAEQWIDLLEASGFEEARRVPSTASGRALAGQAVLVARAPSSEATPPPAERDWLVLADASGMGRRVAGTLAGTPGHRVTVIEPGADAGARVRDAIGSGRAWHALLDLRALDALAGAAPGTIDAATRLCEQAVELVRALAVSGAAPRVWLVTRGAQTVADREGSVAVAQAPIWGLGRVLALEHPELWGGLVDLDPAEAADAGAERLVNLVADPDEEDQVAFRDGRRYVPRLVRAHAPDGPLAIRGDGAYLVTGGLGGLGLKVARWLVDQGARHLVLLGRHGLPARETWATVPPDDDLARRTAAVTGLEALGARVDVVAADVADRIAMTALFASFGTGRPALRGIVHAAAHVGAEPLSEATPAALAAVLAPKAGGAWLLHELSRDLPLDFYVLFSSTTALLGSSRLGHYAAANQFLDALAHHRRTEGRPALSVNWGTWDEMRAASEGERRAFGQGGLLPMRSEDALGMLGRLAAGSAVQATVAAVDWESLIALYEVKRPRPLLAELRARAIAAPAPARPRPGELRARLAATPPETRGELVLEHVRDAAAAVLGLDPGRVDLEQGLFDMGMDSLMAVDLKARLEAATGQRLPSTLTFNYPTVTALAGYLVDEVLGADVKPAAAPTPPPPSTVGPVTDASRDELTEDELAVLLAEKLGRMR